MSMSRSFKMALVAGLIGIFGLAAPDRPSTHGSYGFLTSANATVGRPLTPVSVAGVARRTSRRCAAGVYDC
jgi:hypothetical protein